MRGHILPVLQLVVLPVCCTATYVWSVLLGHVEAGFPYISDTGTHPPESCLFGLLLDVYATITALSVYVRWQQVRTFYQSEWSRGLFRANNVGLVLGLVAAFGVLIVANFQETSVLQVHMVGAFLAFGMGSVYTWVQTGISYKAHLLPGHRACLRHFRLALSLLISISFVLGILEKKVHLVCSMPDQNVHCGFVIVFGSVAGSKLGDTDEQHRWSTSDKGFTEHVLSTAFEWVMAFASSVFFASFYKEFKQVSLAMPVEFVVNQAYINAKVNAESATNEMQHASFTVSTISY